jgi:hypothetical protein
MVTIQSTSPAQNSLPTRMTGNWVTFVFGPGRGTRRFVKSAESAWHPNEALRILHEHHFPGEEVSEVDADIDPFIQALFERQLDAETDRHTARL